MTREEAIRRLGGILTEAVEFENSVCYVTEEDRDPLEMAIKALEQEPCDDAISRQAVFDLMRSLTRWCVRSEDGKFNNVGLLYDDVMFGVDKLLSVTSKPKWIPVSERLPEEGEEVLVSGYDTYNKRVIISRYQGEQYGFTCGLVSAWMPLPKPYEPQERSDKE